MRESFRQLGWFGAIYVVVTTGFWLLFLILLPIGNMVDFAFRPFLSPAELGGPRDQYGLGNFSEALLDDFNRAIFLKTIWASILVTVISLMVCYPIAFMLASHRRSSMTRLLLLAIIVPFLINEVLRAFAWQLLLASKGAINQTLLWIGLIKEPIDFFRHNIGVLVGLVYAYVLFMIFPLYSSMENLNRSQIEAAGDLGAVWWRIHWDIVIPHSKPGIASGCVTVFMLSAGSYAIPQMLGGTRGLWFTQLIYNQFEAINWNMGAAYALCLVVLCLAFIFLVMSLFKVSFRDIAR